ncbi:hypothetical protein ACT4R9_03645 [Ornithobacterium rhinotracheale]|uniref:hypothetical protein n=1 Tax=Ornithobacterium rhinotracheale TaxID=28251 RepID=UPI003FA4BBFE
MEPEKRKILVNALPAVKHFLLRLLILILVYSLVFGLSIAFFNEGGVFLFLIILPIINIVFFLILFIEAIFLKHKKQWAKLVCNLILLLCLISWYILPVILE